MTPITLALDWTPNVNHIGFFVAQQMDFYKENQLDVRFITPADDNYQITPAKKVELGNADFTICPMESVISYRTKSRPFPLTAVATIFQKDLSAIAVKKESSISRPKELDGKVYASYKARYEDKIVQEMIKNDGGNGTILVEYPDKLGIWERLVDGKADATWIFLNWEGIQAQNYEKEFIYFRMNDFDIPYSYSPVIAGNDLLYRSREKEYKQFIQATKQGYLYAADHIQEAAQILADVIPESERNIDLIKSIEFSVGHLGNESTWGRMDENNIQTFLSWLKRHSLEKATLSPCDLVTSEFLYNEDRI
ncbi:MAG: ABC transporter substrate-binding protein [Pseudomonadota bacterium]